MVDRTPRLSRSSWRPMLLALLVVGSLLYTMTRISDEALVLLMLACLTVIPIGFSALDDYRGARHLERLTSYRLSLHGDRLRQTAPDSSWNEIDLAQPFTHQYLYRDDGRAAYRLRQGSNRLDFSSVDPLAAVVVVEHLGLGWPPAAITTTIG